ncbi:MAG: zf-HC2 domain-containing protein [Planctomycetales bacterium]|nr:zf-HC2 domain-containing protein [Planctomycetales bacterium]
MNDQHQRASGLDLPDDDATEWAPCRDGELRRMIAHNRTARLNRALARGVSTGAVVLVLLGGWVIFDRGVKTSREPGGIDCAAVRDNFAAYTSDKVTPEMRQRINEHLEGCPKCKAAYEEMLYGTATAWWRSCDDPNCKGYNCPYCRDTEFARRLASLTDDESATVPLVLAMK